MTDWVTAAVMATDNALSRKLAKLRDVADHSMIDSPAFRQYGEFYTLLQDTPRERWPDLLAAAAAEEQAAQQGVPT
jgi:hypothetical protein